MTSFDYVVLAIIGLSVLLSLLALMSWVVACLVAKIYTVQLAPLLPADIPTESLRFLAAFIILFLATLLVSSLLAIALSQLLKNIGLSWLDRMLGAIFGMARGLIIIGVLVFLAGLTSLPQDTRWRSAMFSAPLEALVLTTLPWMPQEIAKHVKYD
jgi:membrane protein required for colicin V production